MIQNYNKYKILKAFLYHPLEQWRFRQLSRKTNIPLPSTKKYLTDLEKESLIIKTIKENVPFYKANRNNDDFKFYQKLSIQYELHKSGLIDHLWDKANPDAIILYGSFARGEAIDESDIDIYIIGKEIKISLTSHEKKLNKSLHIIYQEDLKKVSKELKNNLANGLVLKGYYKPC